jgi:hypothetical protein
LAWAAGTNTLSNTHFDATIGTLLNTSRYRTGINTLLYDDIEYSYASVAGIYYLASNTADTDNYEVLIDGPVKKTIRLTPSAIGELVFTLYDQVSFIQVEGTIAGSAFTFAGFPYAHGLNAAALTDSLHYYNAGAVVNETVSTQGFMSDAPDEGWACYDGAGENQGLCLVTDNTTLASSNNFWRYNSGTNLQLMLPVWNPNPEESPVDAVSWIVMGDSYQDGRDFWTKLPNPVSHSQGTPEANPNNPTAITLNTLSVRSGFFGKQNSLLVIAVGSVVLVAIGLSLAKKRKSES